MAALVLTFDQKRRDDFFDQFKMLESDSQKFIREFVTRLLEAETKNRSRQLPTLKGGA